MTREERKSALEGAQSCARYADALRRLNELFSIQLNVASVGASFLIALTGRIEFSFVSAVAIVGSLYFREMARMDFRQWMDRRQRWLDRNP
jgi:hypothetical protein